MEEQHSSKKIYIIIGVVLLVIVLALGFLFLKKGQGADGTQKSVGALFGNIGNDPNGAISS